MNEFVSRGLARCLSGLLWVLARLPAPVTRIFVSSAGVAYAALARDARHTIHTNLRHVEAGLAAQGVVLDSVCLLYTSPSPRDQRGARMPSSA